MPSDDEGSNGAGRYVLGYFAGVLGAASLAVLLHAFLSGPDRAVVTTTGGLLETLGLLWGLYSVDLKVAEVRGIPPFFTRTWDRLQHMYQRAKSWVYSRLGWTEEVSRNITIPLDPAEVKVEVEDARLVQHPAPDADNREWIEYLDRELTALKERVDELEEKHRERMDDLEGRRQRVQEQLREAVEKAEERIERLAVGGFQWELVSLFWFLTGMAATTWAPYWGRLAKWAGL